MFNEGSKLSRVSVVKKREGWESFESVHSNDIEGLRKETQSREIVATHVRNSSHLMHDDIIVNLEPKILD